MSKVILAEMFARGAHAGQKHGDRPYFTHLRAVVNVLKNNGYDGRSLHCGGWLHDTIEDTPVTYQDIRRLFGEGVAELVWAVTDELGRNRKERKEKTWSKIAASHSATILKLADTKANIDAAIVSRGKILQMYLDEWPEIRAAFSDALAYHNEGQGRLILDHISDALMDCTSAKDEKEKL